MFCSRQQQMASGKILILENISVKLLHSILKLNFSSRNVTKVKYLSFKRVSWDLPARPKINRETVPELRNND
jgi:hypothetical protein